MTTLPLSEVFGPTFQGEGPHAGRICGFVRLGMCNLSCEWCDTPYTWDTTRYDVKAECPDTDVVDIRAQVGALAVDTVVVSGGEPLIHHQRLPELLGDAPAIEWHLETNGTIAPPEWTWRHLSHVSVSPKVATSSDGWDRKIRPRALTKWADHAREGAPVAFKFVVRTTRDLAPVDGLVDQYRIPLRNVWIMPEGTHFLDLLARHRVLADDILRRGYNTTTRLHTLLWDDQRGV